MNVNVIPLEDLVTTGNGFNKKKRRKNICCDVRWSRISYSGRIMFIVLQPIDDTT